VIANQTVEYASAFAYDLNATDAVGVECFSVNDTTNFVMNCSGYLENNTLLSLQLYDLNVTINDSSGNENSQLMWVNVTDTIAPTFTTIANQSSWDLDAFSYNLVATDAHNVSCYGVNDTTNFAINCSGYLENNTALAVGLYDLNITINDSSGNENFGLMWVNVSLKPFISLDMISSIVDANVTVNESFEVTANVSCSRADCGLINVSLDPAVDRTERTCSEVWGASCDGIDPGVGDYSYDSCSVSSYYGSGGFVVDEVYVDATTVAIGDTINITCNFDCYSTSNLNDLAISYYNGSWTQVWSQDSSCTDGNYSTSVTVSGDLGEQYARCQIGYNVNNPTGTCFTVGFSDNDDVNFTVVEGTKSGLVSTVLGDTPFYTNESNPFNISLNEGESSLVNWWVNATGGVDVVHEFFVYVNKTSDMDISNESAHWNVTIVSGDTAPTVSISTPAVDSFSTNSGLDVNFSAVSATLDSCWYSNDSMLANTTLAECANITGVTWSEEQHNVTVWANDTTGGESSANVNFTIDTTNVSLSISNPSNNSYSTLTTLNVNFTASDTNLDSCWYSNDSMLSNTTLSSCANITGVTWSEGDHNVTIWANDSAGNLNFVDVTFVVDSINPTISISSPSNNTNQTDAGLDVLFSVSDTNLASCWYGNDSLSVNNTLASCVNITSVTWSQGSHDVVVWVNDSSGNLNSTSVTFFIDSINPSISISSPSNNSQGTNNSLHVNYSVSDTNLDSCWYSNDSMLSNTSLSGCSNITTVVWSDGEHNVSIFVNDSSGNENSSSVTFNVDSNNPLISIDSPTNNSYSSDTGLNVTFSVSDSNLESCWYANDSMSVNTTLTSCANITEVTWSEQQHNVTIWANDSFGNVNSTSITFNVDSSTLSIVFSNPGSGGYVSDSGVDVNFSVSGDNLESCWYTNDSMLVNTTLAGCSNITGVTWSEGQHNVTVYANNSVGAISSGALTFYVDLSGPNVTLVNPSDGSVDNSVGSANVVFNCSIVDNLNLANVSLYLTNSSNSSFSLNQTTNVSGTSSSANWTLALGNGNYTWSCLVGDGVGFNNWSLSNFSLVVNSTADVDGDGLSDLDDTLLYNESNVTRSGLSRLNVTVGGNVTFNKTFSGVEEMLFYDDTSLMINFSHNFSSKTFNLKNVSIVKTSTSLVVNLSGQLSGVNKTLYIADNSFVSLCVKDAEISSIGEVSSGCNDDNETDFTACIGSVGGVNSSGLECYDEGSVIRIENLQYSGIRGTQAAVSSSGSSGGGGGSSGGSGGSEIFAGEEIEDFSVTFREGVEYPIFIDGDYHTFKVVDLTSSSATLLFYSLESRVDLELGVKSYLDYDYDGYYDLEILLEKIYGDRAKVVFEFINVKIDDVDEVVEVVSQESEVQEAEESSGIVGDVIGRVIDYKLWLYFLMFLAIGFLGFVWYRYKHRVEYH
jgi:hypothetical protein